MLLEVDPCDPVVAGEFDRVVPVDPALGAVFDAPLFVAVDPEEPAASVLGTHRTVVGAAVRGEVVDCPGV